MFRAGVGVSTRYKVLKRANKAHKRRAVEVKRPSFCTDYPLFLFLADFNSNISRALPDALAACSPPQVGQSLQGLIYCITLLAGQLRGIEVPTR